MSKVVVMDHPLIQHKIGIIRRTETSSKEFREMIGEIAMLMCYEATGLQQVQGLRNLRRGLLSYAARIRLWLWALLLRVLSRYSDS